MRPWIRWRILAFLLAFGALAYFQQKSLTVTAERLMPELHFSQVQVGWLQWAFLLGYSSFQFAGGVVGQRLGARRAFVMFGLLALAALLSMPLSSNLATGTALFVALFGSQLILGLAQAPLFPVSAGVIQAWFPARGWGFANGLQTTAMHLGAALVPPLIVALMQGFGWQKALLFTSPPALALVVLWAWYGRDRPRDHRAVTAAELAELDEDSSAADARTSLSRLRRLVCQPSLILINLSYLFMNYIFYLISNWCFLYLIQERHFTALQSGWLATTPPLGAALGAMIGGRLTDRLCQRRGLRWGYRLVPLLALPVAAALLLGAVHGGDPYLSVLALTLCFGCIELTEGAYWAATMQLARVDTTSAAGVLNTCGNLGGLIGIPIVAYLSSRGAWTSAFWIGALAALVSAVAWFGVDATRPLTPKER